MTSPAIAEVEAAAAARLGWDLPIFRGEATPDIMGGNGAYALVAPEAWRQPRDNGVEVLRLTAWMPFGNAVRQLRNLFCVAARYGARRIELPSPHPMFAGDRVDGIELEWGGGRDGGDAPGLVGEFYYLGGLGFRPSADEQTDAMRRFVRPLLLPSLAAPHPDIRDGDMVLHFRAGDVFNDPKGVHPDYGQPPLAFYLGAVERERPSRVWLVFADRGNPCINAAESVLRGRGVKVMTQSADLRADLHLLLHAPCLVAGIGTFCPAIAGLSPDVRRLYLYGPAIPTLQRLGVHMVEGRDGAGVYDRAVRSLNWAASPEQRALMLSYPREAIAFVDHPPPG